MVLLEYRQDRVLSVSLERVFETGDSTSQRRVAQELDQHRERAGKIIRSGRGESHYDPHPDSDLLASRCTGPSHFGRQRTHDLDLQPELVTPMTRQASRQCVRSSKNPR